MQRSTVCTSLIIVKPHCCLSLYVAYMCLQLTLHSAEANTTENYDLFRTVTSHTFHNLSHSTAYSVTIIAINKAGSGPPVSVNVTTQGTDGAPVGGKVYFNQLYICVHALQYVCIYTIRVIKDDSNDYEYINITTCARNLMQVAGYMLMYSHASGQRSKWPTLFCELHGCTCVYYIGCSERFQSYGLMSMA